MLDAGRVQKELKEVDRDKLSGVTVKIKGSNLQKLVGTLQGPKDTPYQGGFFVVDIELDNQYPFVPPTMRFRTKVWHPNVSSANGAICLDILKDQWSPALTLKTALLSLQALLSSPEPNDPQDAVVAQQYLNDFPAFQRQAKMWTENYAVESQLLPDEAKILTLTDMGFARQAAIEALEAHDGNQEMALEYLLGGT